MTLLVGHHCVKSPQNHPYIQRFGERTPRTQHIVVLTTKIYCNHPLRTQSWIKEEKTKVESGGIHVHAFYVLSVPWGLTWNMLFPGNKEQQHVWSVLGKPIRDFTPEIFTGGSSWMCAMPRMYQNSRLPGGKQGFSINHIVQTLYAWWATFIT